MNQQRFAEIEYCLDRYFTAHLVPVMQRIQRDLTDRQLEEECRYRTSFGGVMSTLADASHMVPGLDTTSTHVSVMGTWNSKSVDDYLEMCRKSIAEDKTIQGDMTVLASEWRKAVIAETGRERYDEMSRELDTDLAYAYLDYRVQQQMMQHMVDREIPRGTAEYIMKKAASGSLIGLCSALQSSPLSADIADRAERAYKPTTIEKATARGLSFGIDLLSTGSVGSWASVGRFAATEVVFDGVEWMSGKMQGGGTKKTVEECISQGVFSSNTNLFPALRQQCRNINALDNVYIQDVNRQMSRKITIPPPISDLISNMEEKNSAFMTYTQASPLTAEEEQDMRREELRKQYKIPAIIAPGQEEAYIRSLEAEKEGKKTEFSTQETAAMSEQTASQTPSADTPEVVSNPTQDNSSGWGNLLEGFGLNGLGDVWNNLGYVISMLPDLLVGMWTGKTKTLGLKDNLVPYASVLAGMFVKNPILKMLLIGMGGANLLNKAGHEALGKADGKQRMSSQPQYLRYADQPLNPRISDVTLSGNTLIATIDKVPCAVRLPADVINACQVGALPLNTLANTILERSEQRRMAIDNNYERQQEQQRQQQVIIK